MYGIVWAFENHPIQIEKFPVLGQNLIHWENMDLHGFNIHDTSVSFVHWF